MEISRPDTFPNISFADWILPILRENAKIEGKVAQIFADDGTSLTYSELLEYSIRVAAYLPKLGVHSGDVVSFVTRNCHECSVVALGCNYAGVVMSPSIPDLTASGFIQNFRLVKPKFVIASEETLTAVQEAVNTADPPLEPKPQIFVLKKLFKDAISEVAQADPATFKPVFIDDPKSHVFLYMFSSGTTTGKPKAVKVTDYGFIRTILNLARKANKGKEEDVQVYFYNSPVQWVSWWFGLSRSILMRWTRIVIDDVSVPRVLDTIHQYRPGRLGGFRSIYIAMVLAIEENPDRWDVSSVQYITLAGDAISKVTQDSIAKTFNAKILQNYGSTEIGILTATDRSRPLVFGSVGKPISRVKLVDPHSGEEIRELNTPGELVSKWAIMSGYLDDPEATAATFDEHGWARTGDLAYYHESGDIFFVGRLKTMFKYRGYQISPGEIEDIIAKIPDIKEAAVTGKWVNEIIGDIPTAIVVRNANSTISEKEIQEFVEKDTEKCSITGGVLSADGAMRMIHSCVTPSYFAWPDVTKLTGNAGGLAVRIGGYERRKFVYFIVNHKEDDQRRGSVARLKMANFKSVDFPNSSFADFAFSLLRKHAETEGKIAQIFVDDGTSWTYSELLEHSVHVAAGLPKLGINSGDVVSFVTRNNHELYAVALGCSFAGVTMAPSVPDLTASGLRQNFLVVKPKFVVAREESIRVVEAAVNAADTPLEPQPRILEIKKLFKDATAKGAHADPATFKPVSIVDPKSNVFLCLFSSGTTGRQKAVKLTDYGLIRSYFMGVQNVRGGSNRFFNTSQINWISWWASLVRGLTVGWTRIFMDEVSVHRTLDAIHKYKPGIILGLGSMFIALGLAMEEDPGRWDISSIERITIGGDAVNRITHERIARMFNIPIHQEYGSTECGSIILGDFNGPMVFGSIGKPVFPVKLVDPETGEEIREANKSGEIISELAVMSGYVDDPEATAATYDEHGWVRTGDIAYFNESGDYFIVNRIKAMFKYRGFQISPSEIEEIILKIPGVQEVAVTGKSIDVGNGDVPIAFVVRSAGSTISEKEIQEFVEKEIDHDSKRLRGGVIFMDCIPTNPNGKIDRPQLRDLANKL